MNKNTIYLCGPINGRSDEDAKNWREHVKARWLGFCLDPMRRDYRGQESGNESEIVRADLEDIDLCDGLVVYFDKPSVGTSMEVFYAKYVKNKPVVVINASGKPLSPWLIHHSDHQSEHISSALAMLDMLIRGR